MSAKVEIYTSSLCGYCSSAKRLLAHKEITFDEIDVTFDAEMRRAMTERTEGRTSVPQIFINGHGIGGCDDLYALESSGKLDALLAEDQAS
ncbi:MAG: glutaredoxin 3 [Alphaproteobacteria bacterium]|nr:glutaredoxin 3 [Alphaproteobacteria bacterium]